MFILGMHPYVYRSTCASTSLSYMNGDSKFCCNFQFLMTFNIFWKFEQNLSRTSEWSPLVLSSYVLQAFINTCRVCKYCYA